MACIVSQYALLKLTVENPDIGMDSARASGVVTAAHIAQSDVGLTAKSKRL